MKTFAKCSAVGLLPFLFVLILLIGKLNASSSGNNELQNELRLIHEQLGLIKEENQNQNVQISLLKEMIGFEDHTEPDQGTSSIDIGHKHHKKRPARLLPLQLLFNRNETNVTEVRRFYGPPTNCSELSQLGYTLNGYYHVKSANISDINQVETVYCKFKQAGGIFNSTGNEKRISLSHLQLPKSGSVGTEVHFFALLNTFTDTTNAATIKFDDVKLNIGEAYDSKSGIFKAPKFGIYSFFFMGYIDSGHFSVVAIYQNNTEAVGAVLRMGPGQTPRDPVIRAILELKRGDTIQVKWAASGGVSSLSFLSFSGSILQELQ